MCHSLHITTWGYIIHYSILSSLLTQAVQEQAVRKNVSIVVVGLPEATPVGQTPALHPNHDESQYIIRGE